MPRGPNYIYHSLNTGIGWAKERRRQDRLVESLDRYASRIVLHSVTAGDMEDSDMETYNGFPRYPYYNDQPPRKLGRLSLISENENIGEAGGEVERERENFTEMKRSIPKYGASLGLPKSRSASR